MDNKTKAILSYYRNSENKKEYFLNLGVRDKIKLINALSKKELKKLLNQISESELLEVFKKLDPDEIADFIVYLSHHKQKRILSKLNSSLKEKVNFLLKFAPESAAGLMNLNYIIVSTKDSKKEILDRIKKHIKTGKKEPTILVLDENNHLLGELRISNLLFNKKETLFENLKELPFVKFNEDQEEIIDIFKKNKHEKIVVLDEDNKVMGLIKSNDLFKAIEEENTEDFYGISGLHKEEDISDNPIQKVKYRIIWLIINLGTAFLAAYVVSQFQNTISKFVLLAAFMPIIAGMGGNAGTQTTAIIIRALALKKINVKIAKKAIFYEFLTGILNGVIIGSVVAIIAYFSNENFLFGIVAGIAVLFNLIIAAFFGAVIPLILDFFGYDPASSSSVFVTTTTDVFGFLIFLGLATLILV